MKLVIPEYKTLELDTIFLDMNGTIAVDGVIPPSVKERLIALSEQFRIYVLTADTHGNAKAQCEGLPVILETFPTGNAKEYKRELVKATGAKRCVAIGNGRNDEWMLKEAALSYRCFQSRFPSGRFQFPVPLLFPERSVPPLTRILQKLKLLLHKGSPS